MKILLITLLYVFLQYQQLNSGMTLVTEMLCTDLFFQEAWDLPNVWVQLQEENKTWKSVFSKYLSVA